MGMSFGYGAAANHDEAVNLMRQAVELGVTFFDTAECYGPHENEELVAEALAPYKGGVHIATKCGIQVVDGKQLLDFTGYYVGEMERHIRNIMTLPSIS